MFIFSFYFYFLGSLFCFLFFFSTLLCVGECCFFVFSFFVIFFVFSTLDLILGVVSFFSFLCLFSFCSIF